MNFEYFLKKMIFFYFFWTKNNLQQTRFKTAKKLNKPLNKPQDLKIMSQATNNFANMDLSESLMRGLASKGYDKPTEIQESVIPILLEGRDVIAQAQSGTGKTCSFLLGCLSKIDTTRPQVQAVIIADSHELAHQTTAEAKMLGQFMDGFKTACFVGGRHPGMDKEDLRKGAHLVVGTPGRIEQLVRTKVLNLDGLRICILDEADKLLNERGFLDTMQKIFKEIPEGTQFGVFSATLTAKNVETAKEFMTDPAELLLRRKDVVLRGIKQYYVELDEEDKMDTATDLCDSLKDEVIIVFCNKKETVQRVAQTLRDRRFSAVDVHSDLSSTEKENVLWTFKDGRSGVLVTTDALARGIDIQHVSVVINYDYPSDHASFIHRVGRAGRFGRKGMAISLLSRRDDRTHDSLKDFYDVPFHHLPRKMDNLF